MSRDVNPHVLIDVKPHVLIDAKGYAHGAASLTVACDHRHTSTEKARACMARIAAQLLKSATEGERK